ncbi:UDP-2,4-diacetamido-2,4,6-trideoxy-beta-L-altropyranose hydrolase [Paenibacillus sp. PK3_47]|uniref:UDP-2,4-diacetamido-2,4, 6-trideoxy-beta-L-altropyranose hydrolase n=1 Tax=Paenibacillus sp. PK3_47 TaxID=2072642 RepID=UPI00201DCC6C|nr:UDP-2,4-diacetamido-2,4,6-trideoxy-beta-L-altropyranose hydrolase [Paenibacillus sp. PK3_47]UQZ36965.1 UDP-2,4-diacetamido-2,4,6-trideoxy-beta-L-altropyranose hydrolase [Paenibacillus sp. PK3_47]
MVTGYFPGINIFFRVDSSYEMGTGHVMRCLTLADELKARNAKVSFVCRDLPGNLADYIRNKGYPVFILPFQAEEAYPSWLQVDFKTDALETAQILTACTPVDCLIIDHYGIDLRWEKLIEANAAKIIVIDDLADRPHLCSIVLDPNSSSDEDRYHALVPDSCIQLVGTGYAILRPEFRTVRKQLAARDGRIHRILVFFGGTDPTNDTLKTLQVLNKPQYSYLSIDVVAGKNNRNKVLIEDLCSHMANAWFHCQIDNMAELMGKADLSIGAGGSSTWERCYLGLPSLSIVTADNQRAITQHVHDKGATFCLGDSAEVKPERIEHEINKLLTSPALVKEMSRQALQLMGEDKWGAVVDLIMGGDHAIH